MKPFAIEARIEYVRNDKSEFGNWSMWNTYKTIESMLQGLSDLRKQENISYWRTSSNGKRALWKFIWTYRPLHRY